MPGLKDDPLPIEGRTLPPWMNRRFLLPFILFVVLPVALLVYVAGSRWLGSPAEAPPEKIVHDLKQKWEFERVKIEAARAHYRVALEAKRAGEARRDEALRKLEETVGLFEAAIAGAEAVLDENAKAMLQEKGASQAEVDRTSAVYRKELGQWRMELDDANKVLGSLRGTATGGAQESG